MNIKRSLFYILAAAMASFNLAPFLWLLLTSFKDAKEVYAVPMTYLPMNFSLSPYVRVISNEAFTGYLVNSLIAAGLTTSAGLILAVLAAYAISRIDIRGKGILRFCLIAACIFPQVIFLVPLYELMARLHLMSRPAGLALPYIAFSMPLAVWLLAAFFDSIPRELEEQAMVDGFSRFRILQKIVLPLSWPAVATAAILIFIGPFAWNEFLFALSFMISDGSKTVPVGLSLLSGASMYEMPWNEICAASVLTTLPLVVFVLVFQRRVIEGLTRGALKG